MTQPKQKKIKKRASVIGKRSYDKMRESDGTYFLKLVVFVLLGTLWLKFQHPISWLGMPFNGIPAGFLIGLILVNRFEKIELDRKIWYAILIVVTIICYFVPAGVLI
jgi:hypothetical protein